MGLYVYMLTRQLGSRLHKKRTYGDKNAIINTWVGKKKIKRHTALQRTELEVKTYSNKKKTNFL